MIDPGIGFAKSTDNNFEILRRIKELKSAFQNVLVLGASRKKFLRNVLGENTVFGDAAVTTHAISQGVNILRIHDFKEMYEVSKIAEKLYY
jgi:dihydropteroate synthase